MINILIFYPKSRNVDEVREAVSDWSDFAKEAMVSKKSWQSIATVLEQLRY